MRNIKNLFLVFVTAALLASCKKELINALPEKQNISAQTVFFAGNRWDQLNTPNLGISGAPSTNDHNISFSANDKVYVCLLGYNQLWLYDPVSAAWSQVSNSFFPPDMYSSGYPSYKYAFTNGNNVYFISTVLKSLKQYSLSTSQWSDQAAFPGMAQTGVTAAFTTSKGYIMSGANGSDNNGYPYTVSENWEYDFAFNTWTARAATPGNARCNAASFAIGDKVYFGTGISIFYFFNPFTHSFNRSPITNADWYEFSTTTNTWVRDADFGGGTRQDTRGFVINGAVYLGMGSAGYYTDTRADLWLFNPPTNTWVARASYPPGNGYPPFNSMVGAANHGYSITEELGSFWQYTPYYAIF